METTVLYSTLCTPGKATNTPILLYMIANSFSAHYPLLSYMLLLLTITITAFSAPSAIMFRQTVSRC